VNNADHYLTITPHAADHQLLAFKWSHGCDAVVGFDDRTVALHEKIKLVLEGVYATAVRPPFVWVLDLLDWCRRAVAPPFDPPADLVWGRLRPLVVAAKPTARNLGLLVAFLCEDMPQAVVAPTWAELNATLERRRMFGERTTTHPLPGPPLSRREFAAQIDARLQQVTNRQLVGLLLTGERELPDPEPVAQVLLTFPERLAATLAEFRSRDRLVGAAFLAPLIDGALALPPRRPTPDRLPQGGYADVTTRGIPDRLLLSQFALDADEFVRRFAENELLYFRREEPHAAEKPTRVLLLDQGVRTWGPVRLGLAGAAIAVLTRDPARFAAVAVGLTSCDAFHDPWALRPGDLATRLEASDLSAHPADLLDRALRLAADGPRDIVLLTHPRNARELAVRETLLDLRPDDRLFLLTLDDAGEAELLEADERGMRSIRRFRIDLVAAAAAKVAAKPTPPARALPAWAVQPWTGDVEPVPFPFRAGLVADVDRLITFDADATWVVVLGRDGALHAKRLDSDEPLEVLPRAMWRGHLLGPILALLPMRNGFALAASGGPSIRPGYYAAGYDFTTRVVKCFEFGEIESFGEFVSFPDKNCIAVRSRSNASSQRVVAVADFVAREWIRRDFATPAPALNPRASRAAYSVLDLASTWQPQPASVVTVDIEGSPSLRNTGDSLTLTIPGGGQARLYPIAEGEPIFRNAPLNRAVLAADTLAVVSTDGKVWSLWVLNVANGAVLYQQSNVTHQHALTLSPDGRWVATQLPAGRMVEVRDLNGAAVERLANGGYHSAVEFHLAADCLVVRVGRSKHRFWLNRIPFVHEAGGDKESGQNDTVSEIGRLPTAYDTKRFETPVEAGPWVAAYDRWGQVVLMNAVGDLLMHVCVCRGQWAVVLPDGTRCGSAALLGGAPTPDAERLIGEALRDAGRM
jgi:hypothetical protein